MKYYLFHGTDCLFDEINLSYSKDKRDFGKGFYTTTIFEQAESWAKNKKKRNGSMHSYVYEYEFDLCDNSLLVKHFDGVSAEWLEMVKDNRSDSGERHSYDVVSGPVANDNTMLTVTRYIQGIYGPEEALKRLNYCSLNDQVSFHSQRALSCLHFLRRKTID